MAKDKKQAPPPPRPTPKFQKEHVVSRDFVPKSSAEQEWSNDKKK